MAIPTLAMIPSGYKAGKLYSVLPSDGTGDFTVARNSVATRVNQSGLIEEVGVNVPRLDYSAGGCPVLLTEIESTNLLTYSEDLSQWSLTNITLTPNSLISPSGVLNAGKIVTSTTAVNVKLSYIPVSANTIYTYSFYCYYQGGEGLSSRLYDNTNGADIEYYDYMEQIEQGKWKRVTRTFTTPVGCTNIQFWLLAASTTFPVTAYYWGAQLEEQPAATSYIKTTGTIQTREADLVNGAGSTATFNSLEHTFFVDLNSLFESGLNSAISIVGSTGTVTDNRIRITKEPNDTDLQLQIRSGGSTVGGETLSNIDFSIKQKLAVTVKENEVKYYRNGFLVATTTGTIPLPVSLGEITLTSGSTFSPLAASTKDIRYYNQVLTEAETLELMSYDSFNEMASALQYTIK